MKVETVSDDSLQLITFTLINELNKKKENYAVPIDQVREIRNFSEITNVPKAKKYVKGIMNLRGLIIPVIDIKKRLGFGEAEILKKTNYKIIIADVRDAIYGLIVDKVDQVIQIPTKNIEPIPNDSFESHHYIKGVTKINGDLVVLLDIIALLEDSENNPNNDMQTDPTIPHIEASSQNSNEKKIDLNDEDIPEELKEILREDNRSNSTTRETK